MKKQLQQLFLQALDQLQAEGVIPAEQSIEVSFERSRQKDHGDFATNLALILAKAAGRNPRDLALLIIEALPAEPAIHKVDVAGPGFINIWLAGDARNEVIGSVFE
ncbi:MAG: hypothetical protein KJP04_07580, partial [Arenicella sp.]|nr:hypothetical protein [Arenicella sp.]